MGINLTSESQGGIFFGKSHPLHQVLESYLYSNYGINSKKFTVDDISSLIKFSRNSLDKEFSYYSESEKEHSGRIKEVKYEGLSYSLDLNLPIHRNIYAWHNLFQFLEQLQIENFKLVIDLSLDEPYLPNNTF